ncbi:MAG: VirB4-like conjugal transfer ATPase, CD1110 family [Candidatus Paceibacteria bacterium]
MIKFPFPKKSKGEVPEGLQAISEEELYKKTEATLRYFVSPERLEITPGNLKISGKFAKTIFLFTYPRYLSAGWFTPLLNLDEMSDISIFYHPLDTAMVLRQLRKKAAQLEAQIAEQEERGMVRDPVLETALRDVETLRDSLQQGRDRMFQVACYITFFADSEEELSKIESKITNILEQKLVYAKPAIFQQFDGYESTMPLGLDRLGITSALNVGPASTFFPFSTVNLTSDQGILYGINAHNNSLIIFDRFSLENANTVIFAKAGAGKSYLSKLEILRSLMLGTDVLVIDPENEYIHLAEAVGGSVFKISIGSEDRINPFDIPPVGEGETYQEVFRSHILELIGLMKVMLGELSPKEESVLDQALQQTYALRDILPDKPFSDKEPPLMEDLETILYGIEGGEELADKLYKYTKGTFSGFINQPTSVSAQNRFVVFSIRDLEEELRPVAMYIILHFIWRLIRKELKKRILVIDEAWWLMRHEDGANFLLSVAKRARKYYLGLTTITQDIDDFLKSPYGKPIITNSSIQILMKQAPAAIPLLSEVFGLTEAEKSVLTTAAVGEGLFFAGPMHVIIRVIASYAEDQIITTDPSQLLAIKKAKEELTSST